MADEQIKAAQRQIEAFLNAISAEVDLHRIILLTLARGFRVPPDQLLEAVTEAIDAVQPNPEDSRVDTARRRALQKSLAETFAADLRRYLAETTDGPQH